MNSHQSHLKPTGHFCMSDMPKKQARSDELLAVADARFVSILLQNSISNEKCDLPDVQFGPVFIDLVTYISILLLLSCLLHIFSTYVAFVIAACTYVHTVHMYMGVRMYVCIASGQ